MLQLEGSGEYLVSQIAAARPVCDFAAPEAAGPGDPHKRDLARGGLPHLQSMTALQRAYLTSQITGNGSRRRHEPDDPDAAYEAELERKADATSESNWRASLELLPVAERMQRRKAARTMRSVIAYIERIAPLVLRKVELRERVTAFLQDHTRRKPTPALLATIHNKQTASWALFDFAVRPEAAAVAAGMSVAQAHNYQSQWRPHRVERIALRTDTSEVRDEYDRVWLVREALAALDAAREIGHVRLTTRALALVGEAMGVS